MIEMLSKYENKTGFLNQSCMDLGIDIEWLKKHDQRRDLLMITILTVLELN
jgi:hypothetical protein